MAHEIKAPKTQFQVFQMTIGSIGKALRPLKIFNNTRGVCYMECTIGLY